MWLNDSLGMRVNVAVSIGVIIVLELDVELIHWTRDPRSSDLQSEPEAHAFLLGTCAIGEAHLEIGDAGLPARFRLDLHREWDPTGEAPVDAGLRTDDRRGPTP
jgi:hypothetical protein